MVTLIWWWCEQRTNNKLPDYSFSVHSTDNLKGSSLSQKDPDDDDGDDDTNNNDIIIIKQ